MYKRQALVVAAGSAVTSVATVTAAASVATAAPGVLVTAATFFKGVAVA